MSYEKSWRLGASKIFKQAEHKSLTDGIFETGAYGVPSKSHHILVISKFLTLF